MARQVGENNGSAQDERRKSDSEAYSAGAHAIASSYGHGGRGEKTVPRPKCTKEGEEFLEIGAGPRTLVGDNMCFRGFEVRETVRN